MNYLRWRAKWRSRLSAPRTAPGGPDSEHGAFDSVLRLSAEVEVLRDSVVGPELPDAAAARSSGRGDSNRGST